MGGSACQRRRQDALQVDRDRHEKQPGQRGRAAELPQEEIVPALRYGIHVRKFPTMASPSLWLFSGWNWVPAILPRATIAVTGPP